MAELLWFYCEISYNFEGLYQVSIEADIFAPELLAYILLGFVGASCYIMVFAVV